MKRLLLIAGALAACHGPIAPPCDLSRIPARSTCTGREKLDAPARGFDDGGTRLSVTSAGTPRHSSDDVLALAGSAVTITGNFNYGGLMVDLKDEGVDVLVDDCEGWCLAAEEVLTDRDGRSSASIGTPPLGTYAIEQVVRGDGTSVRSTLRVLESAADLVVFDIDGTLTATDSELRDDIQAMYSQPQIRGDYKTRLHPGAKEATFAWADKGYLLVYLTARPYGLLPYTRVWLAEEGFAPGSVETADTTNEALGEAVAGYKKRFLERLIASGFVIHHAYGNASTDIAAYLGAGIAPERVHIIGPLGGQNGTQALTELEGYTPHLPFIRSQPMATRGTR